MDNTGHIGTHIFDVDHTLISGSSGKHFIVTAIREGVLPRSVMLSIPLVYLRYRLGKLKPAHINREMPPLRGIHRTTLEEVCRIAYAEQIEPALYRDAIDYIRPLQAQGDEIVLATSSVDIIVEPLAERLGIDAIIASSMEFDSDGNCTGRFHRVPTFGEEKRARVLRFLADRGVSPEQCAFYSDSVYDLPLLEAVGTPVAVNPDFLLARHAKKAGWRIEKFS